MPATPLPLAGAVHPHAVAHRPHLLPVPRCADEETEEELEEEYEQMVRHSSRQAQADPGPLRSLRMTQGCSVSGPPCEPPRRPPLHGLPHRTAPGRRPSARCSFKGGWLPCLQADQAGEGKNNGSSSASSGAAAASAPSPAAAAGPADAAPKAAAAPANSSSSSSSPSAGKAADVTAQEDQNQPDDESEDYDGDFEDYGGRRRRLHRRALARSLARSGGVRSHPV